MRKGCKIMDLEEKVKEILQPHIEKSENDKLEEQDWLPT